MGSAPETYNAVGELRDAVGRLDQLLRQLRQWALDTSRDEVVSHDQHRVDPDRGKALGQNTAATAATHLGNAAQYASMVYTALSSAHSELAHLHHRPDPITRDGLDQYLKWRDTALAHAVSLTDWNART